MEAIRPAVLPELPPFTSGAVGYAGYDVVRYSERLPHPPANDRHLPDLAFAFYDHMVVFDHVNKTNVVVAMARLDQSAPTPRPPTTTPSAAIDDIVARLEAPGARAAAGRHRCWRRRRSSPTARISRGPISSGLSKNASSTSAPATSSRW